MKSENFEFSDYGDYLDLRFTYADTKRSQQIQVIHTPITNGTDAISFVSPIALYNPLKTESLLLAALPGVGGVAVNETIDGSRFFVLKTTVPIADLDASEVYFYLGLIAVRADYLEGEVFRVDNL